MKRLPYLVPVFLFLGWHGLEARSLSSDPLVLRTDPPPLNITGTTLQDTCTLGFGSIDLTVTSGAAPFAFGWSNGATSEDLTGISAGAYLVTVAGSNGIFEHYLPR